MRWLLFRKVPKGTNWFYTLGSATMFAFLSQAVTGVFLAMYYRPDAAGGAYESVRNITNNVFLGQFVRGMHKWGSSVMVILVFLHMGRTFFFGAYKYPRELNWVIGVVLLILTMTMSFTGYLLPFDQRSYWATIVGVNINGTGPLLGPYLSDFLRGGPEFSATTLSRFYSIHMLLVPGRDRGDDRRPPLPRRQARHHRAAVAARRGRSASWSRKRCEPAREGGVPPRVLDPEEPGQAVLPLRGGQGRPDGLPRRSRVIIALSIVFGAELGPKANAATTTYTPRPEWYFFFLFELLRVIKPPNFTGLATIGVPTLAMILLFLLPFYDRGPERHPLRRPVATLTGIFVICAMAYLTYLGANAGPPTEQTIKPPARSSRRARRRSPQFYLGRAVVAQSGCEACHKIGEQRQRRARARS